MTAFIAPSVSETQFSGQYGNSSVATGTFLPNAAGVNDTARILKLYAGTKITGARLIHGAVGVGTTLDLGFSNVDGTPGQSLTQLFADHAATTAGSATSGTRAFVLAKDAYVVCTFKGAATGAAGADNFIDVIIDFEFRGQ